MSQHRRWHTVAVLGVSQTLSWGSSYYLPAILAVPIASELGIATSTVFLAFSIALIVSALIGPIAGRAIDHWGGRPVLLATNILFATGLVFLSVAKGPLSLFSAWVIIGIAMGAGLYEAAFSALVRLYGDNSRNAITGITLIAGFASTVGWPLSTLMDTHFGWRGACMGWAALHLLVGIPLNWSLPEIGQSASALTTVKHPSVSMEDTSQLTTQSSLAAGLLAFVFAVTWFTSTAMATHLPQLLQANGASLAVATGMGALIGPAQVAGRLLEFGFLRRVHPLLSARLAALAHPIGATVLLVFGAPVSAVFAFLHGIGNGILTIAKGTLPLALFGPQGYGARQGLLMVPARVLQSFAPVLFGFCLERWGARVLWLSTFLGVMAFGALMLMPRHHLSQPKDD